MGQPYIQKESGTRTLRKIGGRRFMMSAILRLIGQFPYHTLSHSLISHFYPLDICKGSPEPLRSGE